MCQRSYMTSVFHPLLSPMLLKLSSSPFHRWGSWAYMASRWCGQDELHTLSCSPLVSQRLRYHDLKDPPTLWSLNIKALPEAFANSQELSLSHIQSLQSLNCKETLSSKTLPWRWHEEEEGGTYITKLPSKHLKKCLRKFSVYCEVKALVSHVQLFVIPWTIAHQAPLSMEFSR